MAKSDRRWLLPALGAAAAAAALGASGYGYYEFQRATSDPYAPEPYQPARDARAPSVLPARNLPEGYQPNCERPIDREDADLCAQWGAVKAVGETNRLTRLALNLAALGFIFAVLGAIVGLVGTVLIWLAWRETRDNNRIARREYAKARLEARSAAKAADAQLKIAERSANAAARQVEVALRTSELQLRPWLKLEVQGGICKRLSDTENIVSIHVTITNGGVSPAFQAGISVSTRLIAVTDELGPIDLPTVLGQFAPIFPNERVTYSSSFQPTVGQALATLDEAVANGSMPAVVFDVKVSYKAAFSEDVKETAFRFMFFGQMGDIGWIARDREIDEEILPRIEMRCQPDDIMT